jgi:hypothetical protein
MHHLSLEQKGWFVNFFRHLAKLGLSSSHETSLTQGLKCDPQPMPDLLPPMESDRSVGLRPVFNLTPRGEL